MIQISDNTQQIQPSKIRKMFNKALEYDRVLSFTLGEPDFATPQPICSAVTDAGPSEKARPNIPKMRACWLCARLSPVILRVQKGCPTIRRARS